MDFLLYHLLSRSPMGMSFFGGAFSARANAWYDSISPISGSCGRRLPVLVGCYGGHITDRFDGFWAAASRARATAAALPNGAAAGRFVC